MPGVVKTKAIPVHMIALSGNGTGFCGGYPPARVWGSPTTSIWAYRVGAMRAKRLLFTGDCLSGEEAVEWGLPFSNRPRRKVLWRR